MGTSICVFAREVREVIMLVPVVLLLAVAGALAQTPQTPKPHNYPDVEKALSQIAHFSMFLELLRTTGLLTQLKAERQITLFAPTNAALSAIPSDDYAALKADVKELTQLMMYHVTTDEAFRTSGRANDKVLYSLESNLPIRINSYPLLHTFAAEGENITDRNIHIDNGYIQGIESIMYPPEGDVVDIINDNDELTTLARYIASSGLDAIIRADKNITVFAPTDDAFQELDSEVLTYLENNPKIMEEVLLYHVVQRTTLYSIGMRHAMTFPTSDRHHDMLMLIEDDNDEIYLNHAMVEEKDISATNGVIHTIADVLVPTSILIQIEDQGLIVG